MCNLLLQSNEAVDPVAVVVVPVGQVVHVLAPVVFEYDPTAQIVHEVSLT